MRVSQLSLKEKLLEIIDTIPIFIIVLSPPHYVNKAYQLPLMQCCFPAICICINQNCVKFVLFEVQSHIWYQNNQIFEHLSGNNPSVWYTWQHSHHGRIYTTLFWTPNRSIFPQHSSYVNETTLYGRELICHIYIVWWPYFLPWSSG